ncbi:tetratricopeptide repeat protein [Marilutibacter chinensis]|uniref:Tetratricopeptide repeat protein n=1 Tax=Marilutibacter chinensis TaxID=2912247 RepID=A0ABS9HX15_9GAMM|nr:tetratricopeptide repeat protein [Lysobacter chinensis]MCF7222897.1 tetratricopeptide repeat protein [Lysobacter chinensis]
MYEATIDALRRGAAAEALTAARATVDAQPQDPVAHRLLSAALRMGGDRDAALAAIDRAIALVPEDAQQHLERAGLLLDGRQLDEAQASLARAVGLDPNKFPAYVLQAQLAIGRGDLDQAESLIKTAARIAPEDPQVTALEGTLALRRGDADRALSILSQASQRHPDEAILRHALGFAYVAKGHFAFAEQAFRSLLERYPSNPLRAMVADLVRRQGRPGEAVDELLPILENGGGSPALQRLIGEMELEAGRTESALTRLKGVLVEQPRDRRTIAAASEAWRRGNGAEDARATLETLLAEHPDVPDLWYARLLFEPFASDAARVVVERWLAAMPDFVPALEARATIHQQAGEMEQADAIAHRITEINPGHAGAELRVIDNLMRSDPDAAVNQVESLLARARDEGVKRMLRQLLGRTFDAAGQYDAAAATWAELHAEAVPQRLPLPPLGDGVPELPPMAPVPEQAPGVAFLWGAPGSLVERVALTLDNARMPMLADRFGSRPPRDPMQRYGTTAALSDGSLDPSFLVNQWRATHAARGVKDGRIIDWLLWWDNTLLLALRPHLPEARLLFVLRDPRDMLVDWLAFGAPMPFALESPETAADWLAKALGQIADLRDGGLFPHSLIRLDDIAHDPAAIAQSIGDALGVQLPALSDGAQGPDRYASGHWRHYAEALAPAFAILAPVAERLGYPAR